MINEQLVAKIRAGDDVADNMLQLWQQNQGFISKVAAKYSGYAEMEDLKQESYIALCDAVRHYDAGQGVPFINYAAFWIKQGMQRYIETCGGIVRIPSGVQQLIRKYKKIASEYRKYYGRDVTDREMRAFLGIGAEKLEDIKKSARMGQLRSLSEPLGEEEDYTLADSIASDEVLEEDCIKRLDDETMSRELWAAVERLPENQGVVIRRRYKENMTLREIGEMDGVTIEAVRQIQNKAMRTLRIPSRCQKFRGYYEEYLQASCCRHVSVESFQRTWMSEVEREVEREVLGG